MTEEEIETVLYRLREQHIRWGHKMRLQAANMIEDLRRERDEARAYALELEKNIPRGATIPVRPWVKAGER